MKYNIENLIEKVNKLKIESDKWRNNKEDILELRMNKIKEKRETIRKLKSGIEKTIAKTYNGYVHNRSAGYLDVVLDCYDKLLEKEDESFQYIYEKYKPFALENKYYEDVIVKDFEEILKLKKEIFELNKIIKEDEIVQNEDPILISEIEGELRKKLNDINNEEFEIKKSDYLSIEEEPNDCI